MRIVFMGTPDFAVPTLRALVDAGEEVVLTVTQPDRAKDRGKKLKAPPVKEVSDEYGIKVIQPERIKGNPDAQREIREANPDIIVVVAYGRILPKEILEIPRLGAINVHGSLLPKYRGAAPIQHAILDGEEKTGITIMRMDEGLDTGNMLSKAEIEIGSLSAPQLSDKLAEMGGRLLVETLPLIERGEAGEEQDDSLSSYAGMIEKSFGKIDFSEKTADEIERMIRAFDPWPGAYADYKGEVMKIKKAESLPNKESLRAEGRNQADAKPGTIIKAFDGGIDVLCREGILRIQELQMPGKKAMDVASFLRGNQVEAGSILD